MNSIYESAVLSAPRKITWERRPLESPREGQVRIRLEGCGVCGSNLPVWEGRPWFNYPLAAGSPGHEGWGVVEAVGDGVADVSVGERLAALSQKEVADFDL